MTIAQDRINRTSWELIQFDVTTRYWDAISIIKHQGAANDTKRSKKRYEVTIICSGVTLASSEVCQLLIKLADRECVATDSTTATIDAITEQPYTRFVENGSKNGEV